MKDWYLRQSPRDRVIVLVVAVLIMIGGFYSLVWYPLQSNLQNRQRNVENQTRTLQYIHDGAARIRASTGNAQSDVRTSDKAPYLLIDELIRKAGMRQPQRVEPTGADGARVQFNEVEFDQLVGVIAELELYGLKVSTLNVTAKTAGLVSARFNMERGG